MRNGKWYRIGESSEKDFFRDLQEKY